MGSVRLGFPLWSDVGVSYSPSLSGGSWSGSLPLTNLQDRDLSKVARSSDDALSSTRLHWDLGVARSVGLYAIPKWTVSKTGAYARVLAQLETFLFDYEAGDDITVRGGTFARADSTTCATYIDRNGILRTVAANIARDAHFIGGIRHILLEKASTNLVLQASNFGTTWVAVNTPTRVAGAHTASGVTLDLIGDDSGAADEYYEQTITFTGDAVKAVSIHVKKGTSSPATGSRVQLTDTTAPASRLTAVITWSGTVPSVAASTGTYLGAVAMADGVYRLLFATTAVTAANTHTLNVLPCSALAETGNIYAGGVQAENSTVPTSFILTTTGTVTRAADSLFFTYAAVPQALTAHVKMTENGTAKLAGSARLFEIGTGGGAGPCLLVYAPAADRYDVFHDNGGTVRTANISTDSAAIGDTLDIRAVLNADGSVLIARSKNGAAESASAASAANTLAANWSTARLNLTDTICINAIRSVRIIAGVQTLATMQASVYDSGWLSAFPSDISAEDAARRGLNVPFIHIPSTAHTARYGSLQIDDADNAAGYVDLARLVVAKLYSPSINMNVGAGIGLLDSSKRTETDGGADVFDVKSKRRTMRFVLAHIEESEAFNSVWDIKESAGITGQLFAVYNDSDSTALMARRSFLCTLDELGILEEPNVDRRYATAFVLREAI